MYFYSSAKCTFVLKKYEKQDECMDMEKKKYEMQICSMSYYTIWMSYFVS